MGWGASLNFHSGIAMLNAVVKKERNARTNGISLAGNTIGAALLFVFIGNLSSTYGPTVCFPALAGLTSAIFFIGLWAYVPAQVQVSREANKNGKIGNFIAAVTNHPSEYTSARVLSSHVSAWQSATLHKL